MKLGISLWAIIDLEDAIPFTKCIRQGGVESTFQWNCTIHKCLGALVPLWRESGYGIVLDDSIYTHAVWADNAWLFSHDATSLKKMATSLTSILAEHGLFYAFLEAILFTSHA